MVSMPSNRSAPTAEHIETIGPANAAVHRLNVAPEALVVRGFPKIEQLFQLAPMAFYRRWSERTGALARFGRVGWHSPGRR